MAEVLTVGRFAVIRLSRPRRNQTFEGLELDELRTEKDAVARCGLLIVDIDRGEVMEWLRIEHTIDELYDVAVMPDVNQPEAIGFQPEGLKSAISIKA